MDESDVPAIALPHRATPLRSVLTCVAFAVGFALVARISVGLYQSLGGQHRVHVLSDKTEALAASLDHYDVLLVGSSRVYRNIDPVRFDAAMAQAGCESRSFNMGVAGLNVIEFADILDALDRGRADRLRLMLVEDMPPVRPSSFGSVRSRNVFQRPGSMPVAVRDVLSAGLGLGHRLRILTWVMRSFAYESAGVGALNSLLLVAPNDEPARQFWSYQVSLDRRGYLPLEDETAEQFGRRQAGLGRHQARFKQVLDAARNGRDGSPSTVSAWRFDHWRSIVERGRALADEVGLLVMPNPQTVTYSRAAAALPMEFPIFNFNDPDRYPQLYELDQWFDQGHLAREATQWLSARMGEQVCAHLQSR